MEPHHMMSEWSQLLKRLENQSYRETYVRASVNVNLPSQIRALRLNREMTQQELASGAHMKQSRISAIEKPGATRFNVETLVRLAATFGVGLIVKFVPISEMISWENNFYQDRFNAVSFEYDSKLLSPNSQAEHTVISGHKHWVFNDSAVEIREVGRADQSALAASDSIAIANESTPTVTIVQLSA